MGIIERFTASAVCDKCGACKDFSGKTILHALTYMTNSGWRRHGHGDRQKLFCPKCHKDAIQVYNAVPCDQAFATARRALTMLERATCFAYCGRDIDDDAPPYRCQKCKHRPSFADAKAARTAMDNAQGRGKK